MMSERKEILEEQNITIWQGKNGRWFAHIPDDGKGRKLVSKKSKKEVEDIIIAQYKDNIRKPCFPQVYQEWISEKERFGELSASSLTRYRNDYRRFFDEEEDFCKVKLCNMTDSVMEQFIKKTIREKQLTRKAYAGLRTILNGVFKYAKRERYTQYSITTFFQDLSLHKNLFCRTEKKVEQEVFTIEELRKILQYLEENPSKKNLAIALQIHTGLRVGELTALKVEDIELEKNCIHVHRTEYNYFDKELGKRITGVKDVPKTEKGNRHVILPANAMNIVRRLKLQNGNNEYLFMENGKRITSRQINYALGKICKEVFISPRSTHKIRRSYASKLLNGKIDEVLVQAQMGHKDIATTQKYYHYDILQDHQKIKEINRVVLF